MLVIKIHVIVWSLPVKYWNFKVIIDFFQNPVICFCKRHTYNIKTIFSGYSAIKLDINSKTKINLENIYRNLKTHIWLNHGTMKAA